MLTLSQDVVYYYLNEEFEVLETRRSDYEVHVAHPRFYGGESADWGHVVIIGESKRAAFEEWARTGLQKAGGFGRHSQATRRRDDAFGWAFERALGTMYVVLGGRLLPKAPPAAGVSYALVDADAEAVFNVLVRVFDLFGEWRDGLRRAMGEPGGFEAVVDASDSVFGEPFCIMDSEFKYVAYSKSSFEKGVIESPAGEDEGVPEAVLQEYRSFPDFKQMSERADSFLQQFTFGDGVLKNLFFGRTYIGRIAMRLNQPDMVLFRYFAALLDALAPLLEHMYAQNGSFGHGQDMLAHVRQLLARNLDGEATAQYELEELSDALGASGDKGLGTLRLVQLQPSRSYDDDPHAQRMITIIEEQWGGCVSFEYRGKLFVLVSEAYFSSRQGVGFAQALTYFIRENLMLAGISRPFSDVGAMRRARTQTEVALEVGLHSDTLRWAFDFDDCVIDYLLANCVGPHADEVETFASHKLVTLVEHDRARGTEYARTLKAFFSSRFNASEAARALFIHRSSFLSRMDHIQRLAAIDFNSVDELLHLALSFKLLEVED